MPWKKQFLGSVSHEPTSANGLLRAMAAFWHSADVAMASYPLVQLFWFLVLSNGL
jgi:hypothetical protein